MNPTDPSARAGVPRGDDPQAVRRRFGGRLGLVRPLRSGDETQLQEFFRSHTMETIYARYGCLISTMTAERASQLVNVDQARDCALGVFEPGPAGGKLHAVGRYCLDPNGQSAELAFVVRESVRHRGMATTLLQLLIRQARARRLARLWAQVNAQNSAMRDIFRRHGFALSSQPDAGVVVATLDLGAPPAQVTGSGRR